MSRRTGHALRRRYGSKARHLREWAIFDGLTGRWLYGEHSRLHAQTIANRWNADHARRGEHPRNRYRARPVSEIGPNDPWQVGRGPAFEDVIVPWENR